MVAYKNQWGTLFVLLQAKSRLSPKQIVDLIGPALAKEYGTTQKPVVWVKRAKIEKTMDFVTETAIFRALAKPYVIDLVIDPDMDMTEAQVAAHFKAAGEANPLTRPVLHAVKWNLRRRDKQAVDKDAAATTRRAARAAVFASKKVTLQDLDFKPYGEKSTWTVTDSGGGKRTENRFPVPKTPALPPARHHKPVPPPPDPDYPVAKKGSPWGWIILALGAARALSGKG